jgi:hypothetical protein
MPSSLLRSVWLALSLASCGVASATSQSQAPSPTITAAAAPAASTSTLAAFEPDISPFRVAIAADAAQREIDEQTTAALATTMHGWFDPWLTSIKPNHDKIEAFGLALGTPAARVARDFTVGPHRCEVWVKPVCRIFFATLAPKVPHDPAIQLDGRFFDDKLVGVAAEIAMRSHKFTDAEDRVVILAFEAVVTGAFGLPKSTQHRQDPHDPYPPSMSILSYGDSLEFALGRGLVQPMPIIEYPPVRVSVVHRSPAEAAVIAEDEKHRHGGW